AMSITTYPVGDTVFIDSVFGNDLTGQRQNALLPFQTLAAGLAAASANDLIYVIAGTYTVLASLSSGSVQWYFEDGVVLNDA
ncbi:hypothetical protein ACXWQI_09545, partial [Streptococcus pyogenes]